MQYLTFDVSEGAEGITTLEALASTDRAHHAAVMAEVKEVLDWARRRFAHSEGPVEDGMDWDHDLQVFVEDGGWHGVTLTLTGSDRFVADFLTAFGTAGE